MEPSVERLLQPEVFERKLLGSGVRLDGRSLFQTRKPRILKRVVDSPSVVGSAVLSAGQSRYAAAVTAEISPPHGGVTGRLVFSVDIPKTSGVDISKREGAQSFSQTTSCLNQIFSSPEVLDLEQLSIGDQGASWVLYVNVVCLEFDGSLTDWCVAVTVAALEDVKLPSLEWDDAAKWWRLLSKPSSKVGGKLCFQDKPVSQTICLVSSYSSLWLVDPTALEEKSCESVLTVWKTKNSGLRFQLLGPSSGVAINVQEVVSNLFNLTNQEEASSEEDEQKDSWELCI